MPQNVAVRGQGEERQGRSQCGSTPSETHEGRQVEQDRQDAFWCLRDIQVENPNLSIQV